MKIYNKFISIFLVTSLTALTLAGCGSQDKNQVEETTNKFLSIIASDSDEDLNTYATTEVAGGDFVQFFDADALADKFTAGFSYSELSDESIAELDEFCSIFSDFIESYSVSNIEVSKDGTATAIATIKTKFDVEVIQSDESSTKISEAIESYNTDNAEEIKALYAEDSENAEKKVYNDMIAIILEIYEEELLSSDSMTYAITLSLEKNTETDTWYVTNITNYDDAEASSN